MAGKAPKAPVCPHCERAAKLVTGAAIYPGRSDLHTKKFWRCEPCGAYVGCHGLTARPLGTPANAELRRARTLLHEHRLDRIWQHAETCGDYTPEDHRAIGKIRGVARSRVYAFLSWKLGVDREDCHTAMFDLGTCRRAWVALQGVDYAQVRTWYKARQQKEAA